MLNCDKAIELSWWWDCSTSEPCRLRSGYINWGIGASDRLILWATGCVQADVEARPNLFGNFLAQDADDNAVYAAMPSYDVLRTALDGKLAEHNESNTVMNLVLFQQVSCGSAQLP